MNGNQRALLVLCLTLMFGSEMVTAAEDIADATVRSYQLDVDTLGQAEKLGPLWNLTVVSIDDNVFKAEYEAGFVQGRLQAPLMVAARDNNWDAAFLVDQSPQFVKQIPPSAEEMSAVQTTLIENFQYLLGYIRDQPDPVVARNLRRLLYRMIGIYHGTTRDHPAALTFSSDWLPDREFFPSSEMVLGYETPQLTFLDVYFLNAFWDLLDVLDDEHLPKCTAFVKKTAEDVFLTHNSWMSFLDQSMAASFYINGDFFTVNASYPGVLASGTDFGYNNKGLMFNETTHHATYTEPRTHSLWMFIRAALAEQFAGSMDEFFHYISLEPSGTYMNGYMVVDTHSREIGLVEMSYRSFVYFKPNGAGGYNVITRPQGLNADYDQELVQPDYILGVNFPVSLQIRQELKAVENRPARRKQLLAGISKVKDIESAKRLITYTAPDEPLSINGRWDLGYGTATTLQQVPDGTVDAKAVAASMALRAATVKGVFDPDGGTPGFWMKYGTAHIKGKPFIWSHSLWAGQKLRQVPDAVDGTFQLINTHIH